MDLLDHEMPVLAAFDRIGAQFALAHRPCGVATRGRDDANRRAPDLGDSQTDHDRTADARGDLGVGLGAEGIAELLELGPEAFLVLDDGDELKIIAGIEEPPLIAKILSHLERAAPEQSQSELALGGRGPPAQPSLP